MAALATGFVRDVTAVVGPRHVLADPEVTAGYAVDWTGRFRGVAPLVVRPAGTEEVAGVLAACAAHGVAVVPQGGNTGLVGGSVPLRGEVVLSTRRLDEVGPVDPLAAQLTAGAGASLRTVQAAARAAGLVYPVDLAARDSATLGGTVATNAGGLHVLRYGPTRRQLMGVEAVLSDGTILSHLGGLEKDNTGYDLAGLLCGSEGTLGIVTAARLRLAPAYAHRVAALLGFASVPAAVRAASALRRAVGSLEAAELLTDDGMVLASEHLGARPPFPARHTAYLLVECAAHQDPTAELAAAVEALESVEDVAVAADELRRQELWRYREAQSEAIAAVGTPHKLDVTLPLGVLAEFVEVVGPRLRALGDGVRCHLFGHAADGNVHVNVTGVEPDDERPAEVVFELVAHLGGSISAEHGIGTAKRRWLHLARSPAELRTFAVIKAALDPAGILNPNVLVSPELSPATDRDAPTAP